MSTMSAADVVLCSSCGHPVNPFTGECGGCSD